MARELVAKAWLGKRMTLQLQTATGRGDCSLSVASRLQPLADGSNWDEVVFAGAADEHIDTAKAIVRAAKAKYNLL